MQERQQLIDKVKVIDERIEQRAIIFSGLLRGILNSEEEKAPAQCEQIKLIGGGEQMKYRGVAIHKNKNCSTWYTRCTINGKQIYISAKTQLDCYNKLKLAFKKKTQTELKELKEAKEKEPQAMSLKLWYNKWLELYKKDRKETTKQSYKVILDYAKDITNTPINKISSLDILEVLNKINFERQKQKVYEVLKDIFNKAKINKIIQDNPLDVIEKPKHKRVNGNAFSNVDEQKVLEILKNKNLDMFLICLYQGIRRGEMLALTGQDIDLKNKTLRINKSLNEHNIIGPTKNIYSNRVIPIFNNTYSILEKYKDIQGRIFNIKNSTCEDIFRKEIQGQFKTYYTIHSLRHTFITKCQEANIPLHIVQRWVGHNIGSKVTNAVYTHTRETAELENIEKMNNYN